LTQLPVAPSNPGVLAATQTSAPRAPPAGDVVVLLDLSGSMAAIEEEPWVPSAGGPHMAPTRFDLARFVALRLVRVAAERGMSERVGIILFGKKIVVLSAPTTDYGALEELLRATSVGRIDGTGTELGAAIMQGVSLVKASPRAPRGAGPGGDPQRETLLVVTDGDVADAGQEFEPATAALLAASEGVHIDTITVDEREQVEVQTGVDLVGEPIRRPMTSPFDRTLLEACVARGHGRLFRFTRIATLDGELRETFGGEGRAPSVALPSP
jgi:hypothetical protein